jgi:hypothetical protein
MEGNCLKQESFGSHGYPECLTKATLRKDHAKGSIICAP